MKKILTNNIGFKLISLLFAIALWIIVVNIDDPDITRTIQGIPVTILDEDVVTNNSQVYEVTSGKEVIVSVKGPRSMVDKMTKEYFYAYAPFSEKSNVDAVPIYVQFRNSKYDKSCEITLKTMTMKLDIEQVIEKNYEVQIYHAAEVSSAYYLAKEGISPQNVTLKGPESIVNQINSVRAKIDLSGRTQDFQMALDLKGYTDSGTEMKLDSQVSFSVSSVDYTANIYQVREVPLKCGYTGEVASGYEITEVTTDKTTVKIAGPSAAQVESIVLPDELLNVTDAQTNISVEADISVLLPDGVYLCNSSDSIVKITAKVEPLITNTYRIPISDIDKINIPDGYTAEITSRSVSVTLVGLEKNQSSFSVNNLQPYVDLKNTVEGNNEVILKFTVPENLRVTNDVSVYVYLTKIEEDTTASEVLETTNSSTSTVVQTETDVPMTDEGQATVQE